MPAIFFTGDRGRELETSFHEIIKCVLLAYGLTVILINPFRGTVSRDNDERNSLVKGFGHGR